MLMTAQRANNEEKLFMRWVVSYQTSIEYEVFKQKIHANNNEFNDYRTEEDILASVREILEGTNGTEHF